MKKQEPEIASGSWEKIRVNVKIIACTAGLVAFTGRFCQKL
jgi:hypothetical protein